MLLTLSFSKCNRNLCYREKCHNATTPNRRQLSRIVFAFLRCWFGQQQRKREESTHLPLNRVSSPFPFRRTMAQTLSFRRWTPPNRVRFRAKFNFDVEQYTFLFLFGRFIPFTENIILFKLSLFVTNNGENSVVVEWRVSCVRRCNLCSFHSHRMRCFVVEKRKRKWKCSTRSTDNE